MGKNERFQFLRRSVFPSNIIISNNLVFAQYLLMKAECGADFYMGTQVAKVLAINDLFHVCPTTMI